MFILVRRIKSHRYYYLVETERVEGIPRQRVVGYLGNYSRALAALERIQMAAPSKARLAARIKQIEAKSSGGRAINSSIT